jgi:hypothetical protein
MQAWQRHDLLSRATYAMDQLQDVLRQRREAREPVEALDVFAPELQRLFVAAEREALGRALSRCDRSRRARSQGRVPIVSCGVQRPLPGRQALCVSRVACIGARRAVPPWALWNGAQGSSRAPGPHGGWRM